MFLISFMKLSFDGKLFCFISRFFRIYSESSNDSSNEIRAFIQGSLTNNSGKCTRNEGDNTNHGVDAIVLANIVKIDKLGIS